MRAFTLVELAIVIVIAGILAAVAIPIYQGLVEESKWSEGITAAGSIRHSIQTHQARHSGSIPGLSNGQTVIVFGPVVKWESDAFNDLKNFDGQSFVLQEAGAGFGFNTVEGYYALRVTPTGASGMSGQYFVNFNGEETLPN